LVIAGRLRGCRPAGPQPDHDSAGRRNSWKREQKMEKTFGIIMIAVLIVVAALGFHFAQ
jgi:hypothetical protein